MELLQAFWKHILKVSNSGILKRNDENITESQKELRKFMELLNYNPMMNHLVLSKVFQFSSQNDLLRFRLVCKTWHEQATLYLLLQDPIHRVVTRESELTKLLNLSKNSNFFPIQSFYIKMPSLATPPHSLFKTLALPCIVSLKIIIESKHFPGTVKTISLHMKTLKHLVICRVPERSFEALGYSSAPGGTNYSSPRGKLPCLLSLTLRNAKPSRNFLATYDGTVTDLLRAAHGLQSLEFHHWNSITRILREGNISGVRNLRILGNRLSEMDITVLIEKKGLVLDKFSAKVDKYVSQKLIKELLDKKVQGN